jgi:hypothetical protein
MPGVRFGTESLGRRPHLPAGGVLLFKSQRATGKKIAQSLETVLVRCWPRGATDWAVTKFSVLPKGLLNP